MPVLVPRRADRGPRDEVWKLLRSHAWRDWRVVEGHHGGRAPFCRSAALNAAAALAGEWEVAVIADADSLVPEARLFDAIEWARDSNRMVICHDRWINVAPSERVEYLRTSSLRWRDDREIYPMTVSSVIVVPREVWDEVGGFDEGFVGYGYEDDAFARACRVLTGAPQRMVGAVHHLSHEEDRPSLGAQRRDRHVAANERRFKAYAVAKTPAEIRRAQAAR